MFDYGIVECTAAIEIKAIRAARRKIDIANFKMFDVFEGTGMTCWLNSVRLHCMSV
jgi:hypothetical protein